MRRLRALALGAALLPLLAGQVALRAQALSVETMFADASAKEAAVRKALDVPSPSPTVLKAVRTVVTDYENVVRRYPASGYSDDALWRGAMLARDAFREFHEAREQATAIRLLQSLGSQYPSSKFAKQTPAEIAILSRTAPKPTPVNTPAGAAQAPPVSAPAAATTSAPATGAPAASAPSLAAPEIVTPTSTPAPASVPAAKTGVALIKEIRRAVLPEVVRIVIEFDKEVTFHDERIENPSRVFLDLPATRPVPALLDQTIRFESDADLVRQVRLGRHPNQTTRVVLDVAGVSSYSVYPLYSPFRLVIDCLRPAPSGASLTRLTPLPLAPPPEARVAGPPSATARASAPTATPANRPAPVAAAPASRALLSRGMSTSPVTVPLVAPKQIVLPPLAARTLVRRQVRVPAVRPLQRAALQAATAAALAAAMPGVETAAAASTTAARPTASAPAAAPPAAPVPASPTPLTAAVESAPPPTEAARNLSGGFSIARQLGLSVSRIVIDPGHGGHDPGTKGAGTTEAEIVLDIAQKLEAMLQKAGVEVVLTRRTDDFVSLQERTAIANRENADLFLSIHANANNSPLARGVETYFLNFASNLSAAAVAARENAASGQSMAALPDVVRTIALNNKLDESRDFATYVQREMIRNLRQTNKLVKDLGVKQAPFAVLIGAAMPSVLAEISFLTNDQEARLLKGNAYRQRIAAALFEAVRKYQASLKSVPGQATALSR